MKPKKVFTLFCMLILGALFVIAQKPWNAQATAQQVEERTGAWVDTIYVSEIPDAGDAITQLEAGSLDFYAANLSDAALYQRVQADPDLTYFSATGSYNELTFNPVGPTFSGTGKLNPFSVPAIREALNRLVDRNDIAQNVMSGLGLPKFLVISPGQTEYARHPEMVQMLEVAYAYNPTQAEAVISAEMLKLGATKVNGTWHYNGEPVTLIFLIRTEDTRRQIGDYVADQLESIGFTIDRQYKTSAEASQLWVGSDPDEGLWHLYTGAWIMSSPVSRDGSGDFAFFYTPSGIPWPLWQAYNPAPAFLDAAEKLSNRDYATLAERYQLFSDALALSMEDSVRVWLADRKTFSPRQGDTTAAYDLVSGLSASDLWPYTIRRIGQEGGTLDLAYPALLADPWNPVGGSSWVYDTSVQRATQDEGLVTDPNTGLLWPQRVESATIYAQTGTVVTKTLDWVTLNFSDTIEVPDDAWVDWDAVSQVWITAGEKFPETQTARIKSVVQYPTELFTATTWHDGSPLSVADFIMAMILPFDRANPSSAIYDDSAVGPHDDFMWDFKGYRIISTNPLVIEYYTDRTELDAELNVTAPWPNYGRGEGAWHNIATAYLAEAAGDLAFSWEKADANQVEWMNFIDGPSLPILHDHLDQAQGANFIPYANTLGAYITPAEATARYNNLQTWYTNQGHFWIGTGPFYLDDVSYDNRTFTLQRYAAFPDLATKWERFNHDDTPASLAINYPDGAPGSYFNITGTNFPINSVAWIYVDAQFVGTAFTEESGTFTFTLATHSTMAEGAYNITVSVNPTAEITFELDSLAPLRAKEGDYKVIEVPFLIYLPLVQR